MEKRKILVVDDKISFLKSVEEVLQAENYKVFTAINASHAWDSYQQNKPDLVLTDVNLDVENIEDKSGLNFAKTIIRHTHGNPHCPVILMSSDASIGDLIDSSETGVFDFLAKPFDPEVLLEKISFSLA